MIEITRSEVRILRSVLRRAMNLPQRGLLTPLLFEAGQTGLTVRAAFAEFVAEYRIEGSREADTLCIPPSLLVDCEGRSKSVVKIETAGNGRIVAQWSDGNVPQLCTYDPPGESPDFPEAPTEFVELEPRFAAAYRAASSVRDTSSLRYALDHILLRGKTGEIASTDGCRILIEKGFEFPFDEDVLVPASGAFSCGDLKNEQIGVAKTEKRFALRVGPLTLSLWINKEGRFPRIANVIPRRRKVVATLQLAEMDAAFLGDAIKRFPSRGLEKHGVTVDLRGQIAVRTASEDGEQAIEAVLTNSTITGKPMCFVSNADYLARAISLGFRELRLYGPDEILVCHDEHRSYAWMPLGSHQAIQRRDDATRIESPKIEAEAKSKASSSPAAPATTARRKRKSRATRTAPTH